MLRLFILLTAVFIMSGAHANVDDLTFEENRALLWYQGVESPDDYKVILGEHKQEETKITTKLPEELSIPLNTL
ncbi:MAG: hypothetical protein ACOYL6_09090 [Bacteriovoracaceae bacterium]